MNASSEAAQPISDVLMLAVQQATCETFTKISGQEAMCELTDYQKIEGIFGSISFTGERVWTLMLGVPRDTATALGPVFAGFDAPFDSEDMGDMIGELTNVLAGVVIGELAKSKFHAQMAFPTVARGHESGLFLPKNHAELRLCFSSSVGKFWVRIITLLPA